MIRLFLAISCLRCVFGKEYYFPHVPQKAVGLYEWFDLQCDIVVRDYRGIKWYFEKIQWQELSPANDWVFKQIPRNSSTKPEKLNVMTPTNSMHLAEDMRVLRVRAIPDNDGFYFCKYGQRTKEFGFFYHVHKGCTVKFYVDTDFMALKTCKAEPNATIYVQNATSYSTPPTLYPLSFFNAIGTAPKGDKYGVFHSAPEFSTVMYRDPDIGVGFYQKHFSEQYRGVFVEEMIENTTLGIGILVLGQGHSLNSTYEMVTHKISLYSNDPYDPNGAIVHEKIFPALDRRSIICFTAWDNYVHPLDLRRAIRRSMRDIEPWDYFEVPEANAEYRLVARPVMNGTDGKVSATREMTLNAPVERGIREATLSDLSESTVTISWKRDRPDARFYDVSYDNRHKANYDREHGSRPSAVSWKQLKPGEIVQVKIRTPGFGEMILEVRTLTESPIDNQRIVRELNRSTESNSLLSRQHQELLKKMHTFQHGGHDDEISHLQESREEMATQWEEVYTDEDELLNETIAMVAVTLITTMVFVIFVKHQSARLRQSRPVKSLRPKPSAEVISAKAS